jgi:hypothetical protein
LERVAVRNGPVLLLCISDLPDKNKTEKAKRELTLMGNGSELGVGLAVGEVKLSSRSCIQY